MMVADKLTKVVHLAQSNKLQKPHVRVYHPHIPVNMWSRNFPWVIQPTLDPWKSRSLMEAVISAALSVSTNTVGKMYRCCCLSRLGLSKA